MLLDCCTSQNNGRRVRREEMRPTQYREKQVEETIILNESSLYIHRPQVK
jgi:hypothetical protein